MRSHEDPDESIVILVSSSLTSKIVSRSISNPSKKEPELRKLNPFSSSALLGRQNYLIESPRYQVPGLQNLYSKAVGCVSGVRQLCTFGSYSHRDSQIETERAVNYYQQDY